MSEGLEALKEIVDYAIGNFTDNESKYQKDLEIIEKELRVLEAIKEKGVITHQECVDDNKLFIQIMTCNIVLTKGEYNLLQEVLL